MSPPLPPTRRLKVSGVEPDRTTSIDRSRSVSAAFPRLRRSGADSLARRDRNQFVRSMLRETSLRPARVVDVSVRVWYL